MTFLGTTISMLNFLRASAEKHFTVIDKTKRKLKMWSFKFMEVKLKNRGFCSKWPQYPP